MDKMGWSRRISGINIVLILIFSLFFSYQISQAANFSPATVQDLIDDITTANTNNEDDIITLDQATQYEIMGTETGFPFVGNGNNGLPIILPDDGTGTAHTLTIKGSSSINLTEIRRSEAISDCLGNNKFRIFEVSVDATLNLERILIYNGCEDSGAGIYNNGELNLSISRIFDNDANNSGGGIYNLSTAVIVNSTIDRNSSMDDGGGVYNLGTLTLINEGRITQNGANNNGGGLYNAADAGVMLNFSSEIQNNNAQNGDGGGVYNLGTLDLMNNSHIGTNDALNNGGGVYNAMGSTVTLDTKSEIDDNRAFNGNGGGIYNMGTINSNNFARIIGNDALMGNGGGIYNTSDGLVIYTDSEILGNEAFDGGGVYNAGIFNGLNAEIRKGNFDPAAFNNGGGIYNIGNFNLTADQTGFDNDLNLIGQSVAANLGGGIYNNGMMEITNYRLDSLMATSQDLDDDEEGGAIYNDFLGELIITGSSITHSSAEFGGGGIRNLGNITAINTTISTNSTSGAGGGIKNSGELTLTNVTIANNMASEGGGIWDESMDTVNIKNSLVVGNIADVMGANCQGPISNSIGANVTDDPSCPFPVQNFDTANMLGDLGFGGGEIKTEFHSLIPIDSNPAIDSILVANCTDQEIPPNPIEIDQTGIIRPVNFNCDSGAHEFLPLISVFIRKIVSPTSDEEFSFTSSGLSNTGLCSANFEDLTQDDFTLRDNTLLDEALLCGGLPGGGENVYTITEMIPEGQKLNISCLEEVDGLITNSDTGMLSFSSILGGSINCVFLNTLTNTLANVEEATLEQCPLGGTVIQTGPDTNLNGVLDPEEIVEEFVICDEEPGPPGDDGEPGPPGDDGEGFNSLTDINIEPAGPNCANGGFRFDVGLDLNRNGILDPDEITDTSYACNGADGPPGADGSNGTNSGNCTLAGGGSDGGLSELIALLVLPLFIVLGRRLRRRVVV